MSENKKSNNQQGNNKGSYSPEHYRPINESHNERGNYVRENSPAPTRFDITGDTTTNRK